MACLTTSGRLVSSTSALCMSEAAATACMARAASSCSADWLRVTGETMAVCYERDLGSRQSGPTFRLSRLASESYHGPFVDSGLLQRCCLSYICIVFSVV